MFNKPSKKWQAMQQWGKAQTCFQTSAGLVEPGSSQEVPDDASSRMGCHGEPWDACRRWAGPWQDQGLQEVRFKGSFGSLCACFQHCWSQCQPPSPDPSQERGGQPGPAIPGQQCGWVRAEFSAGMKDGGESSFTSDYKSLQVQPDHSCCE